MRRVVRKDEAAFAELCLRLQRGCGVRGWGDGLGTGRREGGARARRALIVAFALTSLSPQSDTAQG